MGKNTASKSSKAVQQARASGGQPARSKRVFFVLGGAVILALVIALVAGGEAAKDVDGVRQTRDVTIAGDSLAPHLDSGADPAFGKAAPVLTGQSFTGEPRIVPAAGKPTLTVFLAHWCPHCQKEVPLLTEWSKSGSTPAGVEVLAVSTAVDPASGNYPPYGWLEKEKFPFPVLADDKSYAASRAYGITGYPGFVVTDAAGKVVWRGSGEIAMADLAKNITDALAGATPEVSAVVEAESSPAATASTDSSATSTTGG